MRSRKREEPVRTDGRFGFDLPVERERERKIDLLLAVVAQLHRRAHGGVHPVECGARIRAILFAELTVPDPAEGFAALHEMRERGAVLVRGDGSRAFTALDTVIGPVSRRRRVL